MNRLQHIFLCAILLLSSAWTQAQQYEDVTLSDQAVVSLLTCAPGQPLYFHYGHAAIRIQDPALATPQGEVGIDWTFNYGVFDFEQEGFYVKFVKGETDYMLALEYTSSFQLSAAYYDRPMSYQPLILTQEEKQTIFDALLENNLPENRYYRYNFVYDNCATRPWQIIRTAMQLPEAEGMSGISWRRATDYYSGKWSWGKYGINLLFGYEADKEMTKEESLFLPENLMNYVSEQGLSEDEDITPFVPRDGTFATSPELMTIILIVMLALITLVDIYRKKMIWGVDLTLFVAYFVLGLIITTMYFFSTHPFVGSNMLILFLNPLWIVPIVLICKPTWRNIMVKYWMWILVAQVCLLVIYVVKGQALHPILLILFAHSFRLYALNKKQKA